jgi:hypothetical protein
LNFRRCFHLDNCPGIPIPRRPAGCGNIPPPGNESQTFLKSPASCPPVYTLPLTVEFSWWPGRDFKLIREEPDFARQRLAAATNVARVCARR